MSSPATTRPQAVPPAGPGRALGNLICDVRLHLRRGATDRRWLGLARNLVANHPAVRGWLTTDEREVLQCDE